jgi:hypothetical protein
MPDPVFGGFTETASLAAFGVLVGGDCVDVGTGVFVFGVSVSVGVGVCVFSLCCGVGDGVSGVGVSVHCGTESAWARIPTLTASALVPANGVWKQSAGMACAMPDVAYAMPIRSTPAATTAAPAIVHVCDLIVVSC